MMEHFKSLWHSHLGRTIIAKHRIELSSGKEEPVPCAPYRTGPKAREIEKAQVQKMLYMKVIDPAKTEWTTR